MSDEPVLETIEEEPEQEEKKTKTKNPERVKQGFKLAAIGQKAKEEKMSQR